MISEAIKAEDSYQTGFRALQANSAGFEGASWLQRLRESAMDRFETLGFPRVEDEEWKYTNVAQIARLGFSPVAQLDDSSLELTEKQLAEFTYPEAGASQLIFVNGNVNAE